MCLFCEIAKKNIPSTCVYEDELVFAFNDINPKSGTHILVIPKEHIENVAGITPENSNLVAHIFEVIAKLTRQMGLTDYKVISNCGEAAGQTVFHLHFHILGGAGLDKAFV